MAAIKRIHYFPHLRLLRELKARKVWLGSRLPAMVLRNMRYSKLEISLRCQRWVMLEDLKSCRGVAREIRLEEDEKRERQKVKLVGESTRYLTEPTN